MNKYKSYSSEKKERNKKSKNIKSNYIKSPTINFFIENTNENSIPYENKTYNCKLLKKETREQFSMEKTKYRKFMDLKEEDNININYFPLIKNRIDVFKVDSNQIEHMINNEEKNKENEKKIEEISDVLNSLDNNDKANIIEEIKNNFDNSKKNNVYNKFIKILARKERQFDNEKRKKQKETIREIEEAKTIDDDALLYSFIDERTDNNSDIVNMGEDIQDNNGEIKKNKWTISKGTLETEEIY